jgi:hypothetical protein
VELAGGNLLGGCALEAQLANAEPAFGAYRRTENPACHRTRRVQFAPAGFGVQHWTGLIVGKLIKLIRVLGNHTRGRVPGKINLETAHSSLGALAHSLRALGITLLKFGQTFAQAKGIELADRENSDTALRTAGTARQPRSAPADRVLKCGINDLH